MSQNSPQYSVEAGRQLIGLHGGHGEGALGEAAPLGGEKPHGGVRNAFVRHVFGDRGVVGGRRNQSGGMSDPSSEGTGGTVLVGVVMESFRSEVTRWPRRHRPSVNAAAHTYGVRSAAPP